MRRLASALFTLLVASAPAMAQPYPDQNTGYEPAVDIDASVYVDVGAAPEGSEVPDVSVFYDRLSPYGSWMDDSLYGYVFVPSDTNYVPYSNGYWKLTDFGWTWIANDQHGWATSHYGRWVWRNRWVWRPDTTWGPAWVQWRESDNFVGWAPLGYDVNAYIPETNWRFIPTVYITSTTVSNYYVRTDVARYVHETRPIVRWNRHDDRRWVAGPDRAFLERNKVRVQRATYQPREIGRLDAAERRQAEQRAAEAKVKYRARITRDAQVRVELDRKRVEVEHRQVEQQRQRARQQPEPRRVDPQEQRKQAQDKQRADQQRAQQDKQRTDQQRAQQDKQRADQQRAQQQREQQQRVEQRRNDQQQRQTEQRKQQDAARQVQERKQQDAARQVQERKQQDATRQVQERKQQDATRQQQERQRQVKEQRPQAKPEPAKRPEPSQRPQPGKRPEPAKRDDRGKR